MDITKYFKRAIFSILTSLIFKAAQASKLMPARMPGAAKIFAGPVNSSYWLPAQHSKLEPAGNYHTNGYLG